MVRFLLRLPAAKGVFIEFHVDALAAKVDAFHGEAKPLFGCGVPVEFDLPSRANDALPWQGDVAAQELCDRSMVERIAGGCGDLSVSGDFSFRYGTNDAAEGGIARLVFAQGVFEDAALEVLGRCWPRHG